MDSSYTLLESQQSGSNEILTSTENKLIVHFSTLYSSAFSGFEAYYFAFSPSKLQIFILKERLPVLSFH